MALYTALSSRAGVTLPWRTIREALDAAYRVRLLERSEGSGPWPCELPDAPSVKLRLPSDTPPPSPQPKPVLKQGVLFAEAYVRPHEIQDLADRVGDLVKAAVGHDLKFRLRIELGGDTPPPNELVTSLDEALSEISTDLKLQR